MLPPTFFMFQDVTGAEYKQMRLRRSGEQIKGRLVELRSDTLTSGADAGKILSLLTGTGTSFSDKTRED